VGGLSSFDGPHVQIPPRAAARDALGVGGDGDGADAVLKRGLVPGEFLALPRVVAAEEAVLVHEQHMAAVGRACAGERVDPLAGELGPERAAGEVDQAGGGVVFPGADLEQQR
jgi:hypothetical protein